MGQLSRLFVLEKSISRLRKNRKKSLFLLPSEQAGKSFIDKMSD